MVWRVSRTQQSGAGIIEVNQPEDLLAYRADWDRLLSQTPQANFFQTLDWLLVYWKHFGHRQRLRTLLLFDGDELTGVMPLTVKPRPTRIGTMRVLAYPLDAWGTCYGPLGRRPAEVLAAGLKHLRRSKRDWDLIELDWTSGSRLPMVEGGFQRAGLRTQTLRTIETSRIDLNSTWDEYWRNRSSKFRNNVRRCEKKLAQIGRIDVVHYRASDDPTGDPRWDLYAMCEQVAASSWQAVVTEGNTITHERVREFLREMHLAATRRGAVSINLLLVNDQAAAFSYNYLYGRSLFGLRMGYDARFAKAGPGTVLLRHLVQHGFERGDQDFDLGEGDSPYKHLWRTDATPSFRVRHYPRMGLRSQVIRLRNWLGSGVALARRK
jgi:CelD/BcsL family acetyltransferase involved in cellulose biosynthesis